MLDHVDKVIGQDERYAFPVDSKLALEVAQKMAKVNVEELAERKNAHFYLLSAD